MAKTHFQNLGGQIVSATSAPTSAESITGDMYVNTTLNSFNWFDGTVWRGIAGTTSTSTSTTTSSSTSTSITTSTSTTTTSTSTTSTSTTTTP